MYNDSKLTRGVDLQESKVYLAKGIAGALFSPELNDFVVYRCMVAYSYIN